MNQYDKQANNQYTYEQYSNQANNYLPNYNNNYNYEPFVKSNQQTNTNADSRNYQPAHNQNYNQAEPKYTKQQFIPYSNKAKVSYNPAKLSQLKKQSPLKHLLKSQSMSTILGGQQNNIFQQKQNPAYFIDALQRFKKDFSVADKQQRQRQREKKNRMLEEKRNLKLYRQQKIKMNQLQNQRQKQNKVQQSRYLYSCGAKKNGFSNGMPVDPITNRYHNNPSGSRYQYQDQQKIVRSKVRAHHLQNASTCGYNPINGGGLVIVEKYIPQNTQARFQTKLGQFYHTKIIDPNDPIKLNPKNILPKHIGQQDRNLHSPIKRYQFQDQNLLKSSYNAYHNQRPFEQMTKSRIDQSNYFIPPTIPTILMSQSKHIQNKQFIKNKQNYQYKTASVNNNNGYSQNSQPISISQQGNNSIQRDYMNYPNKVIYGTQMRY